MRDYIVTHESNTPEHYVVPRVVRANTQYEAVRAVIRDLRWFDRKFNAARLGSGHPDHYGRWTSKRRNSEDTLTVEPYEPADWRGIELIRLTRTGTYVGRVNAAASNA